MKNKQLPWLDLIRFLAAFIVLIVHVRGFIFVDYASLENEEKNFATTIFYFITRLGKEAVIIFFVSSGFLVGGKSIERIILGNFNPKTYLIDRIFRLYVPLFPALILTISCGLLIGFKFNPLEFLANIFALQGVTSKSFMGNAPLWSLAYEFWFYAIIFSIGILCVKNKPNKISGLLLLFLCLIVFTILDTTFLFSWLIGALIYFIKPLKLKKSVLIFTILMIIVSVIIMQFQSESKSLKGIDVLICLPNTKVGILMLSLFFGILIQQLLLIKPKWKIWNEVNTMGSKLAAFSYTLYLTHYPLLELYKNYYGIKYASINTNSIFHFIIISFACIFIAYLVYLPFEKRTRFYKGLLNI